MEYLYDCYDPEQIIERIAEEVSKQSLLIHQLANYFERSKIFSHCCNIENQNVFIDYPTTCLSLIALYSSAVTWDSNNFTVSFVFAILNMLFFFIWLITFLWNICNNKTMESEEE